ncbi:MAG: type II secretion system protein GspN [Desulfuromonas sp.]|nr:MAG: type II secretion system protein GspN [Desulfuromonas sp.]
MSERTTDNRPRRGLKAFLAPLLLGALLLLVGFVVAFCVTFPVDSLRQRIESEVSRQAPVTLTITNLETTFPPGLEARRVMLTSKQGTTPPVTLSSLRLTPLWGSLLSGRPGAAISTRLFDGSAHATIHRDGRLQLDAAGLIINQPLPHLGEVAIETTLQEGSLSAILPPQKGNPLSLQLVLAPLRINGLERFGLPQSSLSLGTVALSAEGKGESLEIKELKSAGGDFSVAGSGSILLADPFERSRLNLQFSFRPSPELDPAVAELIALLARPGRDGSYPVRISGTLARPVVR